MSMSAGAARGRESSGLSEDLRDSETDDVDPFTYYVPLRWWDYILIAINTLWLLPLRLFLILIPSLIFGTIISWIAVACEKYDAERPAPLMGWRRGLVKLLSPCARVFLFGMGFNWVTTRGTFASNMEAPIMVLAPHSSMLDILVAALCQIPGYLARIETTRLPLYGRLTRQTIRCIFVDRDDPDSRMKAVEEIKRRAEMEGIWPKLLVFPEGTTTNRKQLIQFKRGAFLPQLPVQPILIRYKGRLNGMVWGGHGTTFLQGLYITICQFHNSLEVEFLPVHEPSQEEKNDPSLYASNVQLSMAKALGLQPSSQSIEDLLLMRIARSQGQPYSSGMVVYHKAHRRLGITFEDMKKWLHRFGAMDRDKDGFVTVEDLALYLHVPNDACLQAIFNASSPVDDKLSFKKYLYGLVGKGIKLLENEEFNRAMFTFFDKDGDGVVHDSDISSQLPIHELPSLASAGKSSRRKHDTSAEEKDDEPIPRDMDLEQFKSLLAKHPEYPLLFYECQSAGVSSPPTSQPPHQDNEEGSTQTSQQEMEGSAPPSQPSQQETEEGSLSPSQPSQQKEDVPRQLSHDEEDSSPTWPEDQGKEEGTPPSQQEHQAKDEGSSPPSQPSSQQEQGSSNKELTEGLESNGQRAAGTTLQVTVDVEVV